jgi:cellulose synthase operon protein C
MRRASLALLLLFAGSSALAQPKPKPPTGFDLKTVEAQVLKGEYAAAVKQLESQKGNEQAQILLGRALLVTGDHARAEAAARAAAGSKTPATAATAQILLGEIQRATGRHAEARKTLEDLVKRDPKNHRARVQLGLTYQDLGEHKLAGKIWEAFFDEYDAGTIDEKNADQLMYLGIAARYMEDFQGASDQFQEALSLNPNLIEANLQWGELFLEKYNAGDAEVSFDEVLKINPHHPGAHAGMARVRLEQSYDYKDAFDHIDKALAVRPAHPGALAIRAEIEIDNGEYDKALKTLAVVTAANTNDLDARALIATIHYLRDNLPAYEAEKKKVFSINPQFAQFFHVVADFAVKEHRYTDAIALEQEAVKINPKYYAALAAIGTGYLRLGDDKKGVEFLEKAFEGDRFNVRTYNMLDLFESGLKDYEIIHPTKLFSYRVPKDERKLVERYIPRTLDAAFNDMVKRYGFTPKMPVVIELFNDPDHYSVRTVGLPNLSALGVCFGQVITALSPSNGNINWGMVLWHELGHVFAIQLSNSRVPRWYTEGLSEYETLVARPEWRRENDADIWLAFSGNTLPSIADLNSQFMRAGSMNDMVVAYHLSSVTIEFIVKKWGFPKIVEGLKLFGKGKGTVDVIPAITGLSVAQFDVEFRKYLETRLAPYKGTWKVSLSRYNDLTALEKAAAAKPTDAETQAELALGYIVAQDLDRAGPVATKALGLDANNKKALFAAAEVALGANDTGTAEARLTTLTKVGGDGYDIRMRLARLAMQKKDNKKVEEHLTKAKVMDPERSEPYWHLAEMFFKNNREDDALKELERYVYIEQMELAPLKKLVTKHSAKKHWAKVKEFGEMALYINPFDPELHLALADAYVELKSADPAIYEYESALASDPPLRRPAVAQIGLTRAYVVKNDPKKAKVALLAALKIEPENAEALALAKKLGVTPPAAPKPKVK